KNLLLITINLSTYFLQIIFIMMVGHIEKFALSSTAIATSLCVVSGFSVILNVILLGLYMKFSAQCERTRAPISMELFHGLGKFLCYAVPSARMICFEWWSFELLTLLSELLPNPELKVSVLSI
ncbi:hypothetical protein HN51_055750, partial [Arachis hypogaea]